jgi:hypothetical protein
VPQTVRRRHKEAETLINRVYTVHLGDIIVVPTFG